MACDYMIFFREEYAPRYFSGSRIRQRLHDLTCAKVERFLPAFSLLGQLEHFSHFDIQVEMACPA
jgi:hypothetical protein